MINSALRKDTAKLPEEILNECKTSFERHVILKLHAGEIVRNALIDAVEQINEKIDRVETQTTRTNGRVNGHDLEIEKFKETYKVWLIVGGGVFSIGLLIITHLIK